MRTPNWIYVLVLSACFAGPRSHAKVIEDVPGSLKDLQNLAAALDVPGGRPVHILYIHGINATAADDSGMLRNAICTRLRLCRQEDWKDAGTEYPDLGEFALDADPPQFTYLGTQIWNKEEKQEWLASAPFVKHWVTHLRGHRAAVVIDELNWWPLVMKLKCQQILTNDAYLAGPNKDLIGICAKEVKAPPENPGRYEYYPWIKNTTPLTSRPRRAVFFNDLLKTGVEDWGFSDAFLGVGPLRATIEDGIRQLIVKAVRFDPDQGGLNVHQGRRPYDWQNHLNAQTGSDQEFVAVTHSLGSFLLLDTLQNTSGANAADAARKGTEDEAIRYVRDRTALVYFFANQLPLLELANLKSGTLVPADEAESASNAESQLIEKWAQSRSAFIQNLKPGDPARRTALQLVAFSDPSDLLTWRVRPMGSAAHVVNLFVRNSFGCFGLFENPLSAHDNYARNKDVLRVMFGPAAR